MLLLSLLMKYTSNRSMKAPAPTTFRSELFFLRPTHAGIAKPIRVLNGGCIAVAGNISKSTKMTICAEREVLAVKDDSAKTTANAHGLKFRL